MSLIHIIILMLFLIKSVCAESTPSIEINNYQSSLAYIINTPDVVVGIDYEDACKHLFHLGYTWKIVPTTDVNPGCYSPSNRKIMGADTWYCADGSLAYYNIPWWYCPAFRVCPNLTWTITNDRLNCTRQRSTCSATAENVSEIQLMAAVVYGEASTHDIFEEQAAIANALVRKRNSYVDENGNLKYPTVNQLLAKYPDISYAYKNKIQRYKIALCANLEVEYPQLYAAVLNAFDPEGIDYAGGGCYWDGRDLLTKGNKHPHYKTSYKFTDPSHDVLSVGDTPPRAKQKRGRTWYYTYESTSGYGETVFWKATAEFLYATGAPQCH